MSGLKAARLSVYSRPAMPWTKVKKLLLGGEKNVRDPRIFHKMALVAFFAWVGLGADGLSSSNYGPQEAFLSLGDHRHLALYLALMTAATVVTISLSYSQIIELFPTGGGGYVVATKLLGPALRAGLGLRARRRLHADDQHLHLERRRGRPELPAAGLTSRTS